MRSQETDTLHPFDIMYTAEKLRKFRVIRTIQPVAVNDLPEKGDLFHALCSQGPGMSQDLFRITAAFRPAFVRNDAVGAGMRTAVNHRHISQNSRVLLRFRQNDPPGIPFKISRIRCPLFICDHPADDIVHDGLRIGRRRENIHPAQLFLQRLRVFIADHTAHQADDHVRVLLFRRFQRPQPSQCPVFRTLTHHTGVENNDIGILRFFSILVTQSFQCRSKAL